MTNQLLYIYIFLFEIIIKTDSEIPIQFRFNWQLLIQFFEAQAGFVIEGLANTQI